MMYKVVMHGSFQGSTIDNILYYRTLPGLNIIDFAFGGAGLLAANVAQEVWRDGLRHAVPVGFVMLEISVYVLDDTFHLAIGLPFTLTVGEPGLANTPAFSPAACINVRFNLEPLTGANILLGPRRGYVAIGPTLEGDVDTNGVIPSTLLNDVNWGVNKAGTSMVTNLESFSPPLIWFPIRVRIIRNPITGGPLWTGFADIEAFSVDPVASWRRSRKPGVGG